MARTDSKELLEQKIKLLERAIVVLRRGPAELCNGICRAIEKAQDQLNLPSEVECNLSDYVMRSIAPRFFLTSWISDQTGEEMIKGPKLRETRVQWCEWMIKCLKEDLAALSLPKKVPYSDKWPFPRARHPDFTK